MQEKHTDVSSARYPPSCVEMHAQPRSIVLAHVCVCVRMSVRDVLACARERREASRRVNIGLMRKFKKGMATHTHTR